MSDRCRLCDADALEVFYDRRGVPVHQNLPLPTVDAALAVTRGDLRLACCRQCGFIANIAFSEALLRYDPGYENDQTHSTVFDRYVDDLVDEIVDKCGVRHRDVVEVGCGRGTFLRRVCERGDNRGVGFDPAHLDEVDSDGRVRFVRAYYDREQASVPADAIICRHVIEHVQQPLGLLASIRAALATRERAFVFFETPEVEWILDNVVLQDFFYEHCSYFSAETLAFCFRRAGFQDIAVRPVFGGQYLWLQGVHVKDQTASPETGGPTAPRILAAARRFAEREASLRERTDRFVRQLRADGVVGVWGAGAKGVTFVNQFDPERALVDCVIDINPRKQGRFIPGTAHAIVGPESLAARGVRHVLVMNPNYAAEIGEYVRTHQLPITVHTETSL